jgi:hypothetical protein
MMGADVLSREASLFSGITILTVPTIMWGGSVLLGMLTHGAAGMQTHDAPLNPEQMALFRAGHAHAGVWIVLSLVVQILLDSAKLGAALRILARLAAPLGAVAVSGGFFGLAFQPAFRNLLYAGAALMAFAVIMTGIGLVISGFSKREA